MNGCALGKARQKNLGHVKPESRTMKPGKWLHFDISSIKNVSLSRAKFWLMVVDEATEYTWSYFLKSKAETKKKIVALCKQLISDGKRVKFLQCDNAGENKKTEEACKNEGLRITFEYTAPNTPQQNGKVERRFATFYGRIRSMNEAAGLKKKY